MKKIAWVLLAMVGMVGCTDNFKRDNPYDPEAPTGIQEPASLCGYVVSSREGAPISGADVNIVELGRTVTTNDMGMFEFESVPAADWTIEVSVPDGLDSYLPSVRRISLEPGMVIDCPPSGQEVPEVQTIVLRRRPDAPRIIDLSADDEGVVLTFSTESKLTSKRYQLHFESVFVGSDEGARPTFEESDVDIVFENDNLTIATLRPFQNGTVEALSPTNTYDLSIRVFDEDLASTYSEPVRYAHRLVFDQCAYNDDQSINNELCAPLDGSLPEASEAQPTEIDVLDNEYVLVEREDCTIGVWKTEGEYVGCVSFAVDLNDGAGEQCESQYVTGNENVDSSGGKVVAWQPISANGQKTFVLYDWQFDTSALSPGACSHLEELGARPFQRLLQGSVNLAVTSTEGSWTMLYNDVSQAALYRDGEMVWSRMRNDPDLAPSIASGSHQWLKVYGDYLILNSIFEGPGRKIALVEISTGNVLDKIDLSNEIVGFEMFAPGAFIVVQENGDLLVVEYSADANKFIEVEFIPSQRALVASDTFWISDHGSGGDFGQGILVILDDGNGILNTRALGYRKLTAGNDYQWLVEWMDRGLGAEVFQSPVLNSNIGQINLIERLDGPPYLLMRTQSNSFEQVRLGTFEFSP